MCSRVTRRSRHRPRPDETPRTRAGRSRREGRTAPFSPDHRRCSGAVPAPRSTTTTTRPGIPGPAGRPARARPWRTFSRARPADRGARSAQLACRPLRRRGGRRASREVRRGVSRAVGGVTGGAIGCDGVRGAGDVAEEGAVNGDAADGGNAVVGAADGGTTGGIVRGGIGGGGGGGGAEVSGAPGGTDGAEASGAPGGAGDMGVPGGETANGSGGADAGGRVGERRSECRSARRSARRSDS